MYIKSVRNRATDDFRNFSLNLSLPAFKGEHCLWEPCPRQSVLGNRCRRTSAPLKPCTHVETRNRICIWVIWGGVGVWWGGGNNVHVDLNTHGLYGVHMGVGLGWGGGNNVHVNLKICHATLWDLLLHLHTYVMLRCGIFSCTCTRTSCYAVGSSLALAHVRRATLWDLLLHLHTYVMLRCGIFSCTCTRLCVWSSLTSISIF